MNWGLIGYGVITPEFAESLVQVEGQNLYAIASRSNAESIIENHPEAIVYSDYQDLYQDANIDIVYIGTPHNFHFDSVIQCLENGKHVLCEKPIGISVKETQEMITCARKNKKFLMEGMWTRYLPAYRFMKESVEAGKIGEVRLVRGDFSVYFERDDKHRMWNPNLAGGSLLDLGVYPVGLVNDIFGEPPMEIAAFGNVVATGVDESICAQFKYANGRCAQIYCGLSTLTQWEGTVYGTKGWIEVERFFQGQKVKYNFDGEIKNLSLPYTSTGFYHEIIGAVESIQKGLLEAELFTHDDSMASAILVERIFNEIK